MAPSALLPVRPHSGFPSLSLLNLRDDLFLFSLTLMWGWGARGPELGYTPWPPLSELRPCVAVVFHLLNRPSLSIQAFAWQQISTVSVLPIRSCDPALTVAQTSTTVPQILPGKQVNGRLWPWMILESFPRRWDLG